MSLEPVLSHAVLDDDGHAEGKRLFHDLLHDIRNNIGRLIELFEEQGVIK